MCNAENTNQPEKKETEKPRGLKCLDDETLASIVEGSLHDSNELSPAGEAAFNELEKRSF